MRAVVLSAVVGFFTPFVFILGAEPFLLSGCVPVALYLAIAQFFIARKGDTGLRGKWPTLAAMDAPIVGWVLFIAAVEKRDVVFAQAVPMLLSGCAGSLAGALVAARGTASERPSIISQAEWRTVLRVGAGLLLAVAAVLAALVIPAVARDTSPNITPRPAVMGLIAVVLLHILVAARILRRTRSPGLPDVAGTFGLLLGLLLLGAACVLLGHDTAMHLADIALFACAGGDFLVGGSSLAAALAPFIWLRHSHS
jgi:hypothetical protein